MTLSLILACLWVCAAAGAAMQGNHWQPVGPAAILDIELMAVPDSQA